MARVVVEEDDVDQPWRCGSCGTVCSGMHGTERKSLKCSNCGHGKTDDDPWLDPDVDGPALTGQAATWAKLGENKHCDHCGESSRADARECEECGAPFEVKAPPAPPPRVVAPPAPPRKVTTAAPVVLGPAPVAHPRRPSYVYEEPKGVKVGFTGILVIAIVTFFLGLVIWALWPTKTVATVTGIAWTRTEQRNVRVTLPGSGWIQDAPPGAVRIACETRFYQNVACDPYNCNPTTRMVSCPPCSGGGTRQCNPRQVRERYNCRQEIDESTCVRTVRSNGNGSARRRRECDTREVCDTRDVTRYSQCEVPRVCNQCPRTTYQTCYHQCPVNREWCSYTYRIWQRDGNPVPRNGTDHNPMWPGLVASGVDERIDRTESYTVRFADVGDAHKTWSLNVTDAEFNRYNPGQRWLVSVNALDHITPLSLEPR